MVPTVTVEAAVSSILAVLLDYLSIAILFCLIYLLFQLVTGNGDAKGLGFGRGKSGDDEEDDDDPPSRRRRVESEEPGATEEGEGEHEPDEEPAAEQPDPRQPIPDGQGRIEGHVISHPHGGRAVPGAVVWVERRGRVLRQPIRTRQDGSFTIDIPLPQDELIVHAAFQGLREGIHLYTRYGGRPEEPIALSEERNHVREVRVPLLAPPQVDPTEVKPDDVVVDKKRRPDPPRPEDEEYEPKEKEPDKKKHTFVDLAPHFLSIEDQNPMGACTAFSSASMLEYLFNRARGKNDGHRLSKMQLWIHTRIEDSGKPSGWGSFGCVVCDRMRDHGVARDAYWPWNTARYQLPQPTDSDYDRWLAAEEDAPNQMVTKHVVITPEKIVRTLLEGYPVYIGIPVHANFISLKGGTLQGTPGGVHGYHAICIVGYDSHRTTGSGGTVRAYKVRNSWGTTWGEMGYGWIEAATMHQLLGVGADALRVLLSPRSGKKKEQGIKVEVSGRVLNDDGSGEWRDLTGAELMSAKTEPLDKEKDGRLHVLAFGQVKGEFRPLSEPVLVDVATGRFSLTTELLPEQLEPHTSNPDSFREICGNVDFSTMPCGSGLLIVAMLPHHEKKGAHYAWAHVVAFTLSHLGRGGLAIEGHPENPKLGAGFSGKPIMFSEQHRHEENVIIPMPFGKPEELEKEPVAHFIRGRVIVDPQDGKYDDKSGKEIYEAEDLGLPEQLKGCFTVNVVAKVAGKMVWLGDETRLQEDKEGHFTLSLKELPHQLEPLDKETLVKNFGPDFEEMDFDEVPGLLVVAKLPPVAGLEQESHLLHVVSRKHSRLGRGGLHGENPPVDGAFSGIPIVLSEEHPVEENVILPVLIPEEQKEEEKPRLEVPESARSEKRERAPIESSAEGASFKETVAQLEELISGKKGFAAQLQKEIEQDRETFARYAPDDGAVEPSWWWRRDFLHELIEQLAEATKEEKRIEGLLGELDRAHAALPRNQQRIEIMREIEKNRERVKELDEHTRQLFDHLRQVAEEVKAGNAVRVTAESRELPYQHVEATLKAFLERLRHLEKHLLPACKPA